MKSHLICHPYLLLALIVFTAFFYGCKLSSPASTCLGCSCNGGNGTFVTSSNDQSDPTSIELSTLNPQQTTVTSTVGGITLQVKQAAGTYINFVANCKDPEGVKDIQIWNEETTYCPGSQQGPGLAGRPAASNPNNSTLGSNVCNSRSLSYSYVVPRVAKNCTLKAVFKATAVNFGGLKLNSKTITINITN